MARGPFLEGPEKFSHPESHSKISNLLILKRCFTYSYSQEVSGVYTSLFLDADQLKMALQARKVNKRLLRNGPQEWT